MRHVEMMVFDLDGTLIASGEDLASAINHMMRTIGLEELSYDKIMSYIGDGVKILVERSIGFENMGRYAEALDIFREYYAEHLTDRTHLYPGVKNMLKYFAKKKKVIITNKLHEFTLRITDHLGISAHFDAIIGMGKSPFKKPDPAILAPILQKTGVEPSYTVIVGDGLNDIMLAKNSNALSCAHLNGLCVREKLQSLRPDYMYEDISELCDLFD